MTTSENCTHYISIIHSYFPLICLLSFQNSFSTLASNNQTDQHFIGWNTFISVRLPLTKISIAIYSLKKDKKVSNGIYRLYTIRTMFLRGQSFATFAECYSSLILLFSWMIECTSNSSRNELWVVLKRSSLTNNEIVE